MSDAKVVGLRGQLIPTTPLGEPVLDVVSFLEGLLAEAKNGNIRAIGCSYVIDDGTASPMTMCGFKAEPGRGRYLECAVHALERMIGRWLDE